MRAAIALAALLLAPDAVADDWLGPSPEKMGPFMINVQAGAAIGLHDTGGAGADRPPVFFTTGVPVVELGIAITRNRRAYLLIPLQAHVGSYYTAYMFPLGIEYDFKLPPRGLYIAARLSGGYALVTPYYASLLHFGFVTPELAVKYVVRRRWNLGFEPFGLPIGIGRDDNHVLVAAVAYRVMLSFGASF